MTGPDGDTQQGWAEGGPERLYVLMRKRERQIERVPFDLVSLVVSQTGPNPGAHPEKSAILRMCASPLSIAEISAYLSLPASTVTALVADLVEGRLVEVRAPASAAARLDIALLEAVMDGLSKI
jgi:hypothetical protein